MYNSILCIISITDMFITSNQVCQSDYAKLYMMQTAWTSHTFAKSFVTATVYD